MDKGKLIMTEQEIEKEVIDYGERLRKEPFWHLTQHPTKDFKEGLKRGLEIQEEKLKMAVERLEKSSQMLDKIKYSRESRIYILEEDEYETVFSVRDFIDLDLLKIKAK
jgi:16S rRNA U516 pseudouridylate synthase RsuA-like enzyme